MAFSAFIDDGYNESGCIHEVDRLHPEVRFDFRPFTATEWMRCLHECDGLKLSEVRAVESRWLAAHLLKWDVADRSGNIVPINADTIAKIKPQLFGKLFRIVSGQQASDTDSGSDAKN